MQWPTNLSKYKHKYAKTSGDYYFVSLDFQLCLTIP